MRMQSDEAARLQQAWIAKGNPPCSHPETSKEYFLGSATGDRVCKTCGADIPRTPPAQKTETMVIQPENIRKGDVFDSTGYAADGSGQVTTRHTAIRIESTSSTAVSIVVSESIDGSSRNVVNINPNVPIEVERTSFA